VGRQFSVAEQPGRRPPRSGLGVVEIEVVIPEVPTYERAGIEVAYVEVAELRSQLLTQVTPGAGGHLADLSKCPAGLRSDLGQPFGTEHEQRGDREDQYLAGANVEHVVLLLPKGPALGPVPPG